MNMSSDSDSSFSWRFLAQFQVFLDCASQILHSTFSIFVQLLRTTSSLLLNLFVLIWQLVKMTRTSLRQFLIFNYTNHSVVSSPSKNAPFFKWQHGHHRTIEGYVSIRRFDLFWSQNFFLILSFISHQHLCLLQRNLELFYLSEIQGKREQSLKSRGIRAAKNVEDHQDVVQNREVEDNQEVGDNRVQNQEVGDHRQVIELKIQMWETVELKIERQETVRFTT